MEKDIINENKIIEITKPLSMEDYTGDNSSSKCFNIDKNEYAIAKENEELFASIDEDTIILSVKESERLLRLPMFYGLKQEEIEFVCDKVYEFFGV